MSQKLRTVDIKGKQYVEVSERIRAFRSIDAYKGFSLTTEIIQQTDKMVMMRADIKNPVGVTVASGHAMEMQGSSFINKLSHIENCETSAWGRALANLGIGVDSSVASAEEVINAVNNRDNQQPQKAKVNPYSNYIIPFGKNIKGKRLCEVPRESVESLIEYLEQSAEKQNKKVDGPALDLIKAYEGLYGI